MSRETEFKILMVYIKENVIYFGSYHKDNNKRWMPFISTKRLLFSNTTNFQISKCQGISLSL